MKLTLEIAGGLAPGAMSRRYELDSSGLDDVQQRSLDDLVRAALDEPHREPSRLLRDARSYEIHIASADGDRTLVVYDGAIPPAAHKLIDAIKSHGQL